MLNIQTIYKYTLSHDNAIQIPKDAVILSAQFQGDWIQIWALVDLDNVNETRFIRVFGTGEYIEKNQKLKHISTIQKNDLVFHVFEVLPEEV